ncbi:MAG: cobalamin-dependent protein [Candidatus Omnitrophota bacterium]
MINAKRKIKILFRWNGYNLYSLSALTGLLSDRLDPAGFDVKLSDTKEDLLKEIRDTASPIVAAYSFCSPQYSLTKQEIKTLRETAGGKVKIICGGPHASALPETVLEAGADAVFTGEAEESLPDFLNRLRENPGAVKEKIIPPLPLKDFDTYPPFSDRSGLITPLEMRRGCGVKCSFCQTPRIFKNIRERSIEYAKKYAKIIKKTRKRFHLFPHARRSILRRGRRER